MATTVLTERGHDLQTKVQNGTTLEFTRMAIGDGETAVDISTLTSLINETFSLPITNKIMNGDNVTLETIIRNDTNPVGSYIREVGVFAKDPVLGEILYSISNAGAKADYLPPSTGAEVYESIIGVVMVVGRDAVISVTIDSSVSYTKDEAATKITQAETNAKTYADTKATQAETNAKTYADTKATTAETNAKLYADTVANTAETNSNLRTDGIASGIQVEIDNLKTTTDTYNISTLNKDAEGIFTTIEYSRSDGKLYMRSVSSGGTSPQYATETQTFYGADGTTVTKTIVWTLTYDVDGDLISRVVT